MPQKPQSVGGVWKAESDRLTKAMTDLTEKLRVYQEAYDVNIGVLDKANRAIYAYERQIPQSLMTDLIRALSGRKTINREQM